MRQRKPDFRLSDLISCVLPISIVVGLVLFQVGTCNASPVRSNARSIVGCLPCSHEYLTASYFDYHNDLLDSDFHDFFTKNNGSESSDKSCKGLTNHSVLRVPEVLRKLDGEGSHRHLVSSMNFDIYSDALSQLQNHYCEAVIIERLPVGVFADPFELQHLVERKVFLGASVFGDTNLELPSALSNRSIVEIHMDIGHCITSKNCESVVQLPLHARYPPLDASGYAEVIFGKPDLFLRCRERHLQNETCSWLTSSLDIDTNGVMWRIPCGDESLARIVSMVTFVSALCCSLLIVFSAVHFFSDDQKKVA